MLRLPQSHAYLAGETAHIFKIDNNGKPLFVISLDENFTPALEVIQPSACDLESRVNHLESRLESLEKSSSSEPATLADSAKSSEAQGEANSSSQHIDNDQKTAKAKT